MIDSSYLRQQARDCYVAAKQFDRMGTARGDAAATQCRINAATALDGADENDRVSHAQEIAQFEHERLTTAEGRVRETRVFLVTSGRHQHGRKERPVRKSSRLHPGHDDGYRIDATAQQALWVTLASFDDVVNTAAGPDVWMATHRLRGGSTQHTEQDIEALWALAEQAIVAAGYVIPSRTIGEVA